jgi:periodic tryptophan protein 2
VESFSHTHDVFTVSYRPDGKQLACSTLDGQIYFWDPIEGQLMWTIEGRRNIAGGRLVGDRSVSDKKRTGVLMSISINSSYDLSSSSDSWPVS